MQTLKTQRLRAFTWPHKDPKRVKPSYADMLAELSSIREYVEDKSQQTIDNLIMSVRSIERIDAIVTARGSKLDNDDSVIYLCHGIFESLGPIKRKLDDNKKISKEDNKALKQIAFKAKRLYAIERAERQVLILSDLKASIPIWGSWGGPTIIFDTETLNVSHGQQIRFGVAQVRGLEYHELAAWIASGRTITRQLLDRLRRRIIFYNAETVEEQANDIPAAIALLQSYADKYGYELLTQEQFITDVFLRRHSIKGSVIMPVMVIGQNLPFDISAITGDGKWGYSQGEMYGGFTFNLHGDKTEDVEYPRLRIKKIGFAKHMFKFSPAGWVEYKQNGYHFIDIPQLALMFAVKREGAIERSLDGKSVGGKKGLGCAELGAERETTVDQTLIRGLVTAFRVFVSGLSSV